MDNPSVEPPLGAALPANWLAELAALSWHVCGAWLISCPGLAAMGEQFSQAFDELAPVRPSDPSTELGSRVAACRPARI